MGDFLATVDGWFGKATAWAALVPTFRVVGRNGLGTGGTGRGFGWNWPRWNWGYWNLFCNMPSKIQQM